MVEGFQGSMSSSSDGVLAFAFTMQPDKASKLMEEPASAAIAVTSSSVGNPRAQHGAQLGGRDGVAILKQVERLLIVLELSRAKVRLRAHRACAQGHQSAAKHPRTRAGPPRTLPPNPSSTSRTQTAVKRTILSSARRSTDRPAAAHHASSSAPNNTRQRRKHEAALQTAETRPEPSGGGDG